MSGIAPHEIETRSMEIIDGLLPPHRWTPGELAVVKRLVHTSGEVDMAGLVRMHPDAIAHGVAALQRGPLVVADVQMVRMGINASRIQALGGTCECLIDDPQVIAEAKRQGRTRAQTAVRTFGEALDDAIVAIGNAPTALREVLAMAAEGIARPTLVVGMPVGFVDAAESKAALMASDLVYISIEGTRGGSPLAAATVNALLRVLEAAIA
ncbi:MAG: precorrin-8X methylmutase [Armatimonadota bacterium]